MSIESARAYYERLVSDESFRTKIQSAASNDERQAIIRSAGYNFTKEECDTVRTQILDSASDDSELGDAELEAVAGGVLPVMGLAYAAFPFQGQLDDLGI